MDDIIEFVKSRNDIGSFYQSSSGALQREELVLKNIYTFLEEFRHHCGKNLKWNSIWKKIKRAGFALSQDSKPKTTHLRHYIAVTPQTGLVEMSYVASIIDEMEKRGNKRPRTKKNAKLETELSIIAYECIVKRHGITNHHRKNEKKQRHHRASQEEEEEEDYQIFLGNQREGMRKRQCVTAIVAEESSSWEESDDDFLLF